MGRFEPHTPMGVAQTPLARWTYKPMVNFWKKL